MPAHRRLGPVDLPPRLDRDRVPVRARIREDDARAALAARIAAARAYAAPSGTSWVLERLAVARA